MSVASVAKRRIACDMLAAISARVPAQPDPRLLSHSSLPPPEREQVVEFIAVVCEDFGLLSQTAGLAVAYFDRYCSRVPRDSPEFLGLELVATTGVLVAAKFLETRVPSFSDLCRQGHTGRTPAVMQAAEMHLLSSLGWDLHVTTPHVVLGHLFLLVEASPSCQRRTEFLVDMSYYENKALQYSAVEIAAASLLLAWNQLGDSDSEANYTRLLASLCSIELPALFQCKVMLLHHFTEVFAWKAPAEAAKPNCESPVSVCHDLGMAAGAPPSSKQHFAPVARGPVV